MLTSLARSQRALCRIIEAVANHVESSEQLAAHVADNLKTISDYQHAMLMKMTSQRRRPTRKVDKPGKLWINNSLPPSLPPPHN